MSHQLEQLLTCCICLDRFRNPKLLPCQHSVCMEPCMEGLVDYVRRQVKCPECRAEHRIPYNGVQGFPSNVTLQRFLEAQIEITGETPDPHTGQFMERCAVCNEKNYLSVCAHCEKKVCEACKAAHSDVLKREIGRINNQVKRATHRLSEQLENVDRNIGSLKGNTTSIVEEIENISKRLQKAIRDRESYLKAEVQGQYDSEMRNMKMLKDGLEVEISNVNSNIELAEKHMDDETPWDDAELMDTKDIFLKTMEFIRSFDYDTGGDYARKTRFMPPDDLNKLASSLSNMGELNVPNKHGNDPYAVGQSSFGGGGLSKSKSDHRLAVQFREQEEAIGGRTSPVSRRRFGDRPAPVESSHDSAYESDAIKRRFRSRFIKRGEEEEDRGVRFTEDEAPKGQRARCIDTEDVSRGPLSGIVRIYDSPRVIQRLLERDSNAKKKKEDAKKPAPVTPKPVVPVVNPFTPPKAGRQISEDEIDKIKKQNKAEESTASGGAAATTSSSTYGVSSTTTSLPSSDGADNTASSYTSRSSTTYPTSNDDDNSSRRRDYSSARTTDYGSSGTANGTSSRTPSRKTSVDTGIVGVTQRSQPFSRSSSNSSIGDASKGRSAHTLDTASYERKLSRSNSIDSNKSLDGSTTPRKEKGATGAAFSTDELKNRFGRTNTDTSSRSSGSSYPNRSTATSSGGSSRFQSRFLGRAGTPSVEASKESGNDDDEEESSEESESDDSEESSEEEEEKEKSTNSRSDGGLLGRSAQNTNSSSLKNKSTTDSGYGSRYGSSSDNSSATSSTSRYGSSNNDTNSTSAYGRRPSLYESKKEEEPESKYSYTPSKYLSRNRTEVKEEETKPAFQSRFLNRSKSSAILGPDGLAHPKDDDSSPAVGTGRARFEELKERRQRIARSKSSAGLDEDEATTTDTSSPSTYKSKYSRDNDTTSSSRTPALSSTLSTTSGRDDGGSSNAQLSNWARYLKNKYGNKTESATGTSASSSSSAATPSSSILNRTGVSSSGSSGIGSSPSSTSTSTARAIARSRSSHLLGLPKDGESSEDDSSKNADATPTSPALAAAAAGMLVVPTHPIGSIHRNQYLRKQHLLLQIGSRGSEPGNFTWPRGVAVGPDNSIVVADSSNHRVQVFDQSGRFIKEFGSYGSHYGEFDCLAGVAVNRIGQYIIADRYNHRIQVFDPSGMFLRSFGSQGSADSRFSYPWGVTTDALGFIYVCDKENHRVQVFQSDGTFVGKFGSLGSKPGQLEHPHYIAVSSTNRVIVSDSNNHRIQIFDINGKVQATFGGEGAGEGQFKFPRGVAVDEQGYIIVADCGNNRIQMFQEDGTFLRAFGCWGSQDGEFKGLEGVAVMPNGNILVCDRENHRVQIF